LGLTNNSHSLLLSLPSLYIYTSPSNIPLLRSLIPYLPSCSLTVDVLRDETSPAPPNLPYLDYLTAPYHALGGTESTDPSLVLSTPPFQPTILVNSSPYTPPDPFPPYSSLPFLTMAVSLLLQVRLSEERWPNGVKR